jgi:uncharacterized protein YjiS (DUF1127 family)
MLNRNLATTAPQIFTAELRPRQSRAGNIVEFFGARVRALAAWHNHRRERQKLSEYLASDHRAASDIGYPHRLK